MKFAVYCYDFPHWKTQNGLLHLFLNDLKPSIVIGAPWIRIDIGPSKRIVHKGLYLAHPGDICKKFGFDYMVSKHDECKIEADFAIILGARILKNIQVPTINFHAGLLPWNRGMDNAKWAIKHNIPQGVTAHFINESVDGGWIIRQSRIPIYHDDTLMDIQFRLQNKELEIMVDTMQRMLAGKINKDTLPIVAGYKPYKTMTSEDEHGLDLDDYKRRWA